MTKLIIQLHKKKLVTVLANDKSIDDFYIALNDATKFVKFGSVMFAKSEFEYAYLQSH